MKSRTFPVYSDPGHAWTKVPKAFLTQIIGANWRSVFSSFSYERGEYVYLEEDEDTAHFINRCRAAGIEPVLKNSSTGTKYSRIRNYRPLLPT